MVSIRCLRMDRPATETGPSPDDDGIVRTGATRRKICAQRGRQVRTSCTIV